jgi:hypothetical protein
VIPSYTYDRLYRLTRADNTLGPTTYAYDRLATACRRAARSRRPDIPTTMKFNRLLDPKQIERLTYPLAMLAGLRSSSEMQFQTLTSHVTPDMRGLVDEFQT